VRQSVRAGVQLASALKDARRVAGATGVVTGGAEARGGGGGGSDADRRRRTAAGDAAGAGSRPDGLLLAQLSATPDQTAPGQQSPTTG